MWQFWLILAGIFFVAEIITVGFLVFWLGVGALLTALVSFITNNVIIQTAVFVISSTILLFCTRELSKKLSSKDIKITNAYSIIGQTGIVTKDILENEVGQIKIGSEIWTANSTVPISKGTQVKILSIEGVKAIVEPIEVATIK